MLVVGPDLAVEVAVEVGLVGVVEVGLEEAVEVD